MRYSVVIDDEANTVLESDLSLEKAERELCRAVNEGLDAYLEETQNDNTRNSKPMSC